MLERVSSSADDVQEPFRVPAAGAGEALWWVVERGGWPLPVGQCAHIDFGVSERTGIEGLRLLDR
ncbi:hypothetical protein CLV71_13916 [Actinophytocola oryzae]|uniref:Uncharacterized protein n=1 Tax=Actinophytocola oryzae TaxID=502181 RepID=A0A4R7UR59_9PSEU|nr:hypothetical protein CLV71_13916 [Actinophytocola oryzae]